MLLAFLSIMTKFPDGCSLKEGFVLFHDLRGRRPSRQRKCGWFHDSWSMWLGCLRSQRIMKQKVGVLLLIWLSAFPQLKGWCHLHSRWVFPPQLFLTRKILTDRHPELRLLGDSKFSQADKSNHHSYRMGSKPAWGEGWGSWA